MRFLFPRLNINTPRRLTLGVKGSISFSAAKPETLTELGLENAGELVPGKNYQALAKASVAAIRRKYPPLEDPLSLRLNDIQVLYPGRHPMEAKARVEVNSILEKVGMVLPDEKVVVIGIEESSNPVMVSLKGSIKKVKATGIVNHTFSIIDKAERDPSKVSPKMARIPKPNGLMVVEAKKADLPKHVPQLVLEMYSSAKEQETRIIRGALSSGSQWLFVVLHLNDDGRGGKFSTSAPMAMIDYDKSPHRRVVGDGPIIITSILAHWASNCFENLDKADWFEKVPR